jgi:hypothetical protein
MNSVAPNTAIGIVVCAAPAAQMTATAEISMVAITATAAPCGVGIRSRIQLASAIRSISGRIAKSGVAMDYDLGTPIVAEPFAAFSALNIHTSPPNAPTMKYTAPNSSDTFTPSLESSPA